MPFKSGSYVKVIDTFGNYRHGFIEQCNRGDIFIVNMSEGDLSEAGYNEEYYKNVGPFEPQSVKLLTEAEKRVIPLLARQMSTTKIGESLNLSPVTIRCRVREIKRKLNINTKDQLYAYAKGLK